MQLSFSFKSNIDIYDVKNFVVHNGNKDIFDFITSACFIHNNIYLLTGSEKSGKTYICNIWNKLKKAVFLDLNFFKGDKNILIEYLNNNIVSEGRYILEDIEELNISEDYLFYLINLIIQKNAILLITSKNYLYNFNYEMKDLNSRFKNIFNFVLKDLNDESKQKIILKLLTDRQLNIDSQTLEIISRKISGNYEVIFNFIESIDELIKSNKMKRITINNIRNLL